MRRNPIAPMFAIFAVVLAGVFTSASGAVPQTAEADIPLATVNQYCVTCHNDRAMTADVSFEGMTADTIGQHPEVFEMAVRKLRGRVMPPPGTNQPADEAIFSLVSWFEGSLDAAEGQDHIPDELVLHRMNRKEYENAVRDLLNVGIDAEELLPDDDAAEGFDNIASVLQVSPSFIEQYVSAARNVAQKAVGRADARPGGWSFRAGPGRQMSHIAGLPLGTRGGILAEVDLPSDGEYQIDVADMATHIWGNRMEFENPLVVVLDNKIVYEAVIGGEEDMKLYDQVQDGALDRVNVRLKNIRFHATAGPHKIGVTFRRRTFAESDDRLEQFQPGGGQERMYSVNSFQLLGPFDASGLSTTPSRETIFTCHPDRGDDATACADQIIRRLTTKAYRRPATDEDVRELEMYYGDGFREGGFEGGIRSAVTGILASPYFLYRTEALPAGLDPGEIYQVDGMALAGRLSFFLWNSIPDQELVELGLNGTLGEPAVLEAQVRRMLADPRSQTLASNFVHQMMDMKRLDDVVADRVIFPYASGGGDPRQDFRTELTLFADSVFAEDRPVTDLLTASHTYLNERIALHYGINGVKGDQFRRVELEQSARWGLLGKGAILMAAAYPNRTSPVLRGAFVLEHIQGIPPATPPPNVEALDENAVGTTNALTVREMMARHRASPACYSCHAVMDPLGFALENFDATGMWRDRDRYAGAGIDSAGELPDGTPLAGPDDLRDALMRYPEQFVQTFTERLLVYATGHLPEAHDMPTVRRIVREAADSDYKFSDIVMGVVESDQFLKRRMPQTRVVETASVAEGVANQE